MITKMSKTKKENPTKKKQQLEKINKLDEAEEMDVSEPLPDKKSKAKVGKNVKNGEIKEADVGTEYTIFIGNLPATTNRALIVKLFAHYGKILFVLLTRPSKKIYAAVNAYVVFDSVQAADKALELNANQLENTSLVVRKAKDIFECSNPKNTVMVKYEKDSVTDDNLHQTFSNCGTISSIYTFKNPKSGECLGRACVQFENHNAVNLALEIKCTAIDEKAIGVERYSIDKAGYTSKETGLKTKKHVAGSSENTVVVKNLESSNRTVYKSLKKFFSSCGEIEYIKLSKKNQDKQNKNMAFVCFKSPSSVRKALKLDGTNLEDKPICVEAYGFNPKSTKPSSPKKTVNEKKPKGKGIKKLPKKIEAEIATEN